MTQPPPPPDATAAILQDPDFVRLAKRKSAISLALTAIIIIAYFGFILLLATGAPLLKSRVSGAITLGIPLGIGVIVLAWLLTGVYVRWANSEYDALVARVREKAVRR